MKKKTRKKFVRGKIKRINPLVIVNEFGLGNCKMLKIAGEIGIPLKKLFYFDNEKMSLLNKGRVKKCVSKVKLFGNFLKRVLYHQRLHFLESKTFRAFRYMCKLPSNGQRSKTNAKTSKKRVIHENFSKKITFRKFYVKKNKQVRSKKKRR